MEIKNKNIENLFKDKFSDFEVEPSSSLWNDLSKKLIISNFLKFGLVHFNIYYSIVAISLTLSAGLYISENLNDNENQNNIQIVDLSSHNSQESLSLKNSEYPKGITNESEKHEYTNKDNSQSSEIESFEEEKINLTKQTPLTRQNQIKIEEKPIATKEVEREAKVEFEKNATISEKENTILEENNSTKTVSEISSQNISTNSNINIDFFEKENNTSVEKNSEVAEITYAESEEKIEDFEGPSFELKNEIFYDTIIIFDTLTFIDTIITHVDNFEYKTKYSVDAYFDNFITNSIFKEKSNEYSILSDELNRTSTSSTGFTVGANLNYHNQNNLILQIGGSYTQIKESFETEYLDFTKDSTSFWNYSIGEPIILIDTIDWEFVYDSIQGNYVHVPILQETITTPIDSALVTDYDSSSTKTIYSNKNTYSYFEIPLIIGYEFKKSKFTFTPKVGLITGIFINSRGKTISLIDRESIVDISKNDLPFIKANFTLLLGMGVNYQMNNNMSLLAEPFYRTNLNSILSENHYISQRFNNIGIRFGVRYRF